jgi:hypothetical protein
MRSGLNKLFVIKTVLFIAFNYHKALKEHHLLKKGNAESAQKKP